MAKCGNAVEESSRLPVAVQFEPPRDLDVINEVHDLGIDSVGIHVDTFDPQVLARAPSSKARTGIEQAWERAVSLFGQGQYRPR